MKKRNVKKNKGRKASKKRILRKNSKPSRPNRRKSATTKKVTRKGVRRRNRRQSTQRSKGANRRRTFTQVVLGSRSSRAKRVQKPSRKRVRPSKQKGKVDKVSTPGKSIPRLLAERQHAYKDGKPTRYYSGVFKLGLAQYKNFNDKVRAVREWTDERLISYYQNKHDKLPRGFMIIIRTKKGRKYVDRSFKGVFTLHPDLDNVRQTILTTMIEFQDEYFDALETGEPDEDGLLGKSDWVFNPEAIAAIFVKFFYARD